MASQWSRTVTDLRLTPEGRQVKGAGNARTLQRKWQDAVGPERRRGGDMAGRGRHSALGLV